MALVKRRQLWQLYGKSNSRAGAVTYLTPLLPAQAVPSVPRAQGALHLVAKRRAAASVIADLRTEGSLKALFPRVRGEPLQAVFLNTAGGLTGGDEMRMDVTAQTGAHVVLSSQAAERVYRAQPGQTAQMSVNLRVGAGGRIDWMPQETIMFDAARLERRMTVDLAPDATVMLVEPLIFGRAAMGEVVHDLHFVDHWRVRRDGVLVFADAVRFAGDADAHLARNAIAGGAGALASVLLAGPQAAQFAQMDLPDNIGVSLIADDVLLVRMTAVDGFALRRDLVPIVEALTAAPIPRVWRL